MLNPELSFTTCSWINHLLFRPENSDNLTLAPNHEFKKVICVFVATSTASKCQENIKGVKVPWYGLWYCSAAVKKSFILEATTNRGALKRLLRRKKKKE